MSTSNKNYVEPLLMAALVVFGFTVGMAITLYVFSKETFTYTCYDINTNKKYNADLRKTDNIVIVNNLMRIMGEENTIKTSVRLDDYKYCHIGIHNK